MSDYLSEMYHTRCHHPGSARAWPRVHDKISGLYVDTTVCVVCCEELPLGPADDSPDVLVELRAAEIAAMATLSRAMSCGEMFGWLLGAGIASVGGQEYQVDLEPGEHAGYLARIIYEHKEDA